MNVIGEIKGCTVFWNDAKDKASDGMREIFVAGELAGRAETEKGALQIASLWIGVHRPEAGKKKKDRKCQYGNAYNDCEAELE